MCVCVLCVCVPGCRKTIQDGGGGGGGGGALAFYSGPMSILVS